MKPHRIHRLGDPSVAHHQSLCNAAKPPSPGARKTSAGHSDLAYTTVATMLRKNGGPRPRPAPGDGRAFIYSAKVAEQDVSAAGGPPRGPAVRRQSADVVKPLLTTREVSREHWPELKS